MQYTIVKKRNMSGEYVFIIICFISIQKDIEYSIEHRICRKQEFFYQDDQLRKTCRTSCKALKIALFGSECDKSVPFSRIAIANEGLVYWLIVRDCFILVLKAENAYGVGLDMSECMCVPMNVCRPMYLCTYVCCIIHGEQYCETIREARIQIVFK